MSPGVFIFHSCFVIIALVIGFWPGCKELESHKQAKDKKQLMLYIAAIAVLIPVIIKAVFVLFPAFEVRIMPVHAYAGIDREFMFPFQVLFIAIASKLTRPRDLKAMRLLVVAVALFVVQQTSWHLTEPAVYRSKMTAVNGVCIQTTDYTCGAAASVTLLEQYDIAATEGEMARLSRTIPKRGVSDIQAADGLQRKLYLENRQDKVILSAPGKEGLDQIPTPFLASTKYSIWYGHMICVLDVKDDVVTIGDPLSGILYWNRSIFLEKWYGTAIYIQSQ